MILGYARISTDDQNLDLQRDALLKAGCERVFEDTASGSKTERTGLAALLASLRKGDTFALTFTKSLELKLGNAGGVRLRYDGEELPPVGATGQVRTLTFPPALP